MANYFTEHRQTVRCTLIIFLVMTDRGRDSNHTNPQSVQQQLTKSPIGTSSDRPRSTDTKHAPRILPRHILRDLAVAKDVNNTFAILKRHCPKKRDLWYMMRGLAAKNSQRSKR